MAILFDNAAAQYEDRENYDYFTRMSFTVGSGSNRILIVGLNTGSRNVSAVTYNGVSLTNLFGVNNDISFWYLLNPDSGTHNIDAALSSYSNGESMGAVSLSGVSGIGALYNSNQNGASLSNNITPTSTSSWLVDCLGCRYGLGSASAGQTKRCDNLPYTSLGMSTKENTSTSQKSMGWSVLVIVTLHGIVEVIDANPPVLGSSKFFQLFN